MTSSNQLKDYILSLTRFLKHNYPECILMPGSNKGKQPKGAHKSINTKTLWDNWDALSSNSLKDGLVIIMRKDLLVIDIDDEKCAQEFEDMFPIIKSTSIQKTSKGFHYFFKRTQGCDNKRISDKARSLKDGDKVLPIDIKTVCSNGTGGIISIFPSPGKTWLRPLFKNPPIDLPDSILDYIVKYSKQDNIQTEVKDNIDLSETELARAFLHTCISKSRADSYNDWVCIGMCLKHINKGMLTDWIIFSKRSDKFKNDQECQSKWETFNVDGSYLTMGTLRMLSKQDNPEEYMKLTRASLNTLILDSINKSQTYIARVIKYLYGDEYVCTNISKNEWTNQESLINYIMQHVRHRR